MSKQTININLLNEHFVCKLCNGYLIDACTISECLHSFCRTCIVNYFKDDENKTCPICNCISHPAKPLLSLKKDRNLQYLVYKIIPNLFKNEMFKRRQFYSQNNLTTTTQLTSCFPEEELGELSETVLKTDDTTDLMNVLIEYNEKGKLLNDADLLIDDNKQQSELTSIKAELHQLGEFNKTIDKSLHHHYLQCPSNLPIGILKKFLKKSLYLPDRTFHLTIDIMYDELPIKDHFTLNDIANIYGWRRKKTSQFHLFYRIRKINRDDILEEIDDETVFTNDKQPLEEPIEEIPSSLSPKINSIIKNTNEEQVEQPVLQTGLATENLPTTFMVKSPCKINPFSTPVKKKYNRSIKRISSEQKRQQLSMKPITQPLIMPRGATLLKLPASMILKSRSNIYNLATLENKIETKLDNEHKSTAAIKTYYSHTSNDSLTPTSFNGLSSFLPVTPLSNSYCISPNKTLLQKPEQQQLQLFENEIIPLKEHNAIMLRCNTVTPSAIATPINYTLNSSKATVLDLSKHNIDNNGYDMKTNSQTIKRSIVDESSSDQNEAKKQNLGSSRNEKQQTVVNMKNMETTSMNNESAVSSNSEIKSNDIGEQYLKNTNFDYSINKSDVSSVDFVEATPDQSIDNAYCSIVSDFIISKSINMDKEEMSSSINERLNDNSQSRNTHSYSDVIKEANKVLTDNPIFTSTVSINNKNSENVKISNIGRSIVKLVKPIATVSPLNSTMNNAIEQKPKNMTMSIDNLPKQISNETVSANHEIDQEATNIVPPIKKRRTSKLLQMDDKAVRSAQICEVNLKDEPIDGKAIEQTSLLFNKNEEYVKKQDIGDMGKKEDKKQETLTKDGSIKRTHKTTSLAKKDKTKKLSKNISHINVETKSNVIKKTVSSHSNLPNTFLPSNTHASNPQHQQQLFQQHAAFFNLFNYPYLIDPSTAMIMNACDPRYFSSSNSWPPPFDLTHLSRMHSSTKNGSSDQTSKTPHDLNSVSLKDFIENKSNVAINGVSGDSVTPLHPFHNSDQLTLSTDSPTPLSTQDNLLSLTRTSSSNSFHSSSRGENIRSKQNHSSKSSHHSSRSSALTLPSSCSANVLVSPSPSLTTVNGTSS